MENKLIYIQALKRFIKAEYNKDTVELTRISKDNFGDDYSESNNYVLCLVDKNSDIVNLSINEMNLNYFSAENSNGEDVSSNVRCIIPRKYIVKDEKGLAVRYDLLKKGVIRIDKNACSKDMLTHIVIINNKVKVGV